MKLPDRIPKRLRAIAVEFPEFGDGEAAWPREEAMKVIESLKGTTVAVSEVAVLDVTAWGYAWSDTGVSIDRLPSEADADYGTRSRKAAVAFIRSAELATGNRLFLLTFPMWKDAA